MRTDDLVAMLSTNVERVDRWQFVRTLGAAILIGAATAFAAVLLALGTRNDLPNPTIAMHVALKMRGSRLRNSRVRAASEECRLRWSPCPSS